MFLGFLFIKDCRETFENVVGQMVENHSRHHPKFLKLFSLTPPHLVRRTSGFSFSKINFCSYPLNFETFIETHFSISVFFLLTICRILPPVYSLDLANRLDEISLDTSADSASPSTDGGIDCCTLSSDTSRHVVSRSLDGIVNNVYPKPFNIIRYYLKKEMLLR